MDTDMPPPAVQKPDEAYLQWRRKELEAAIKPSFLSEPNRTAIRASQERYERLTDEELSPRASKKRRRLLECVYMWLCVAGFAVLIVAPLYYVFSAPAPESGVAPCFPFLSSSLPSRPAGEYSLALAQSSFDAYIEHTRRSAPGGLQPGCVPYRLPHKTSVAYKGVALLFHGFSACPQQYFLLAPLLAAEGYEVFLPLTPGHGNMLTAASGPETALRLSLDFPFSELAFILVGVALILGALALRPLTLKEGATFWHFRYRLCAEGCFVLLAVVLVAALWVFGTTGSAFCLFGCVGDDPETDDLTHMCSNLDSLATFAEYHAAIVRLAPGSHAVLGISLGGSLATAAGRIGDGAGAAVFTRQLILNPFYDLQGVGGLVMVLGQVPGVRDAFMGWGDGCVAERRAGRAGICTFKVKHLRAAIALGRRLTAEARGAAPIATVQLVTVDGDPVVVNSKIPEVASAYVSGGTPQVHNCSFAKKENFEGVHSFLSPWDGANPERKWWIGELSCRVVRFMARAVPFPLDGDGAVSCGLNCSSSTCAFNRAYMQQGLPFARCA